MNEKLKPVPLLNQIQNLITKKDWYSLTESGSFKWDESLQKMADDILQETGKEIDPEELKSIIEDSFTLEALVKVDGGPLIDELLKIDPHLIVWTEGDPGWQLEKAKLTGLLDRSGVSFRLLSKDKKNGLEEILRVLFINPPMTVGVIDDKVSNIQRALSLQEKFPFNKILIKGFTFNLSDPATCLAFFEELQDKTHPGQLRLVVDMDGVLIDTDAILQEIVPEKIVELINSKSTQ